MGRFWTAIATVVFSTLLVFAGGAAHGKGKKRGNSRVVRDPAIVIAMNNFYALKADIDAVDRLSRGKAVAKNNLSSYLHKHCSFRETQQGPTIEGRKCPVSASSRLEVDQRETSDVIIHQFNFERNYQTKTAFAVDPRLFTVISQNTKIDQKLVSKKKLKETVTDFNISQSVRLLDGTRVEARGVSRVIRKWRGDSVQVENSYFYTIIEPDSRRPDLISFNESIEGRYHRGKLKIIKTNVFWNGLRLSDSEIKKYKLNEQPIN